MRPERVDVVVIGGGAAGLMTAFTAGRRGRRMRVIEHANRCGKKILMSGGGRCNFTNTGTTPANFLSSNPHFCKSALARYTPANFIAMVERHGIAYHEKELGQLFCDDSSKQIVAMLLKECEDAGVDVRTSCAIESVEVLAVPDEGAAESAPRFRVTTAQGVVDAESLVVATGGLSIPSMGATGFGYALAKQFGHAVLPTRAGLVPLTQSGKPAEQMAELAGVALPVTARAGKTSFSNAMLVTHRGISGPAILQISNYWQPGETLELDLLPGQDALETLAALRASRPDAQLRTVLSELLPKRFAERLCETVFESRPMKQLDPKPMQRIAETLARFPLVCSGTEGYRTAEVTLGGVDTKDVSSSTMESRRVPGLYFVGEVLDVTGWLGGYNFQWAWASGHAAGQSA
ncbi:NAD(P)/FAD-dependent oxidoreductase [Silanimonas sp.]|uniref:NAD(P)/FAD-dependent oxidoreductase n=1 Tax=Silanimonas sp. TaxID=1929290 RepID=UPI0022C06685|nr:NAD(P)/FAD-dependent oxidoreductase [Silanimonas sp.]MCZ8114561.1 NAD(P)/FAD-dependent oxidoreductase [Silanimonas sp.]